MKRRTTFALSLLTVLLAGSLAAETTTVLLVRHAEKAMTGGSDPELTEEGRARAVALAAMLARVEISAIYSTPFKRTKDTAAPVAAAKGIDITITEVGPDFARSLADRILKENSGRTVLVVGHSNTLGPTAAALGVEPAFELDETEYGDLFVCTIPDSGKPTILRLSP